MNRSENPQPLTRGGVLGLLAILVGVVAVENQFVPVVSRSIPYHLCLKAYGPPQRDDYVQLTITDPLIKGGQPTSVTKELKCVAGDRLSFDGRSHFCNGVKIDDILLRETSDGRPISAFVWNGPIPFGKAYVLGHHPRSYDSRYFGFVDAAGLHKLWGLL